MFSLALLYTLFCWSICPPLLYVFQDDLVNRLGVEAGLFRLHPPYAARMGWSSLLSLASQQTPTQQLGTLENNLCGRQVGRVKSPTSFVLGGRPPCVLFSYWLK